MLFTSYVQRKGVSDAKEPQPRPICAWTQGHNWDHTDTTSYPGKSLHERKNSSHYKGIALLPSRRVHLISTLLRRRGQMSILTTSTSTASCPYLTSPMWSLRIRSISHPHFPACILCEVWKRGLRRLGSRQKMKFKGFWRDGDIWANWKGR